MKKKVQHHLNQLVKKMFQYLDDILLFIGITLIAVGVYQIYVPAGFIVLGICIIAFAFIFARSREGDHG